MTAIQRFACSKHSTLSHNAITVSGVIASSHAFPSAPSLSASAIARMRASSSVVIPQVHHIPQQFHGRQCGVRDAVDAFPTLEQAFALDVRALQEPDLFEVGVDVFEMGGFHARHVRGEVVAQGVEQKVHSLVESHVAVFFMDVGKGGVDVRESVW